MQDFLVQILMTMALPTVISIGIAILMKNLTPAAQAFAQAYVVYRERLLEEAKKFHAEAAVRAVEQAARANLMEAADRHQSAVAMLIDRIPGISEKDANALVFATVAALKEEFKKADEISQSKVKDSGEPLIKLDAPLQ